MKDYYKEGFYMRIMERIEDAALIVKLSWWRLCVWIAVKVWIKRNWNRLNDISPEYAHLAIRLKTIEYIYRSPIGKPIAQYINEDYESMLWCYELGLEGKEYAE